MTWSCVVSMADATIAAVDYLIQFDKCSNEFGRYVEKWNVNVWRLNTFVYWTCSLLVTCNVV